MLKKSFKFQLDHKKNIIFIMLVLSAWYGI